MNYSDYCVLSSLHSLKLAAQLSQGGSHSHGLGIRMVEAERIWRQAQNTNTQLPIVFSNAEAETMELVYWGILDSITVSTGRWTNLAYTLVEELSPPQPISTLTLKSEGRQVSDDFRRAYAVCFGPAFIT